ncbi:hypothetical protein SAMN05428936_10830 [Pelagibacterium halotolerans]|nr:hypothetical protein SAMN05428936_10830 [Pelagibacterium halotolerans]
MAEAHPLGSITKHSPTPIVILGLDPGIREASSSAAGVGRAALSRFLNPFRLPEAGSRPQDDVQAERRGG